jgi:NitT/TauT family transport system permease protein
MPYVVVVQALPKFALVPMFVLWMGFGVVPKILIASINAFFPILMNTYLGATTVPSELSRLFDSFEAGRWARFRKLTLPWALPPIFAGARVGAVLAVLGAIVAEYIGSSRGLGAVLIAAQGTLSVNLMFADFIVLTLLGLAAVKAVDVVEFVVMRAVWGRTISAQQSSRTSGTISV